MSIVLCKITRDDALACYSSKKELLRNKSTDLS